MENLVELFSLAFMQRAFVTAILIGTVTALIGSYVVLRGLAFIGASIAHASFGGVVLGLLLGWNPVITAIIFSVGTGLGIAAISESRRIKEDTAIGIFFAATMALGIFLIGFLHDYVLSIFNFLFGDILAVTPQDLWLTLALTLGVLGTVLLLYKEFLLITFDPEVARAQGFPVRLLHAIFIVLIALTVVVSLKVVGIILVSALLVIPAATAYQLARDFRRMQWLAILFSLAATIGGLLLSYFLDTPSGATIVLWATAIFFAVWSGRAVRLRRLKAGR
jgi:ABC-type Mn2+/Zn2+ transport system permease subunit